MVWPMKQSAWLHKIEKVLTAERRRNAQRNLYGYTIKNVAARAAAWERTSTNCGRGSFSI